MSMVCCLQAVGDSQFERLMRNPEQLGSFIGDEDDEILKFFNTRSNYELHIKTKNYSKSYKGNEP